MDGYEYIEDEIKEVFFFFARSKCECCGKTVEFKDRGQRKSIFGWEAHLIEGWDAPIILCLGEPENCHLNCGHKGDYQNPAVFPEEHRRTNERVREQTEKSYDAFEK